jgi:hypothetical protein
MSLSSLFDGRFGSFLAIFIAICVVGVVVALVMRAWGRGIKPSAGRRLGIVDAFDLDRHRQLVIIRRDHVEHLIMIGGPNDLVVESDIVRSPPMSGEGRRDPVVAPSPTMAAPPSKPAPAPKLPSEADSVAPPLDLRPTPPMPRANPMAPPPRAPEVKPPLAPSPPEPSKTEPPRLSMNINSLEEEMTRLLGRPPEKKD